MAEILVTSLVSHSTKLPRIDITFEKPRIQLSHLEAINFALNILQCVAGAQADAFIHEWAMTKIPDCTEQIAGRLMIDFRDFRDEIDRRERNRP